MTEAFAAADKLDILELFARYAWSLDTADPAGYASLFVTEAVLGMNQARYEGRSAIEDYARELTSRDNWPGSQHYNGQVIFEPVEADRCKVRSYSMIIYRLADGSCHFRHLGLYQDICVRVEGKWFFEERLWQP